VPETTASGACPVATLDDLLMLRPDVVRCPYGVYEQARTETPVTYNERLGGWMVTRYDDILQVLRDTERFSSRLASGPSSVTGLARKVLDGDDFPERTREAAARRQKLSESRVLLFSDPPLHKRQRSLINQGFTPRRVAERNDPIVELVHKLIDDFPGTGEPLDIVPAFAVPIPMTVIAGLLGVPPESMGTFKAWSDAFTAGVGALHLGRDAVIEVFDQVEEFYDYFTDELNKRREHPVDDLLSDLLAARLDGEEPLSLAEMLQMLVQFLTAGNETTTNLLSLSVWKLATDPTLQQRLRATPGDVPNFLEEVLRLEAPAQGLWRVAVDDVEVGGVAIPADSLIYLAFASANRDSAVFAHPDQLSIDDADTRHLSFGRGEHVCLGMNLVKLEAKIALQALLERCDNIALAVPDAELAFHPTFMLHGIRSLPVTFTVRPERRTTGQTI
jgi:cytochrome P450